MKQRFNKNGVEVGETVLLDKAFTNSSKVEILHLTKNGMFAEVKSPDDDESKSWSVMSGRLSKIEPVSTK